MIRDVVDPDEDERLASFVTDSHMRHHPSLKVKPEVREVFVSLSVSFSMHACMRVCVYVCDGVCVMVCDGV